MREINAKLLDKLVLGTAQIGSKYGITNSQAISKKEIKEIFNFCKINNINRIDTATSYSQSENIIGKHINDDWIINTKLPKIPDDIIDIYTFVRNKANDSIKRLNIKNINCLFVHNSETLFSKNSDEVYKSLLLLKKEKIVKKIGISIYTPKELDKILGYYDFDYIQIPINILNQSFADKNNLKKIESNNILIQARSIFLQGLLLVEEKKLPIKFTNEKKIWKIWYEWINDHNLNKLDICLSFVLNFNEIKEIVFGIGNFQNLVEIAYSSNKKIPYFPIELIDQNSKILDPRLW